MSSTRLIRVCGCMAGQLMKQTTAKATIGNRGLMTTAVRLKREITVVEPDQEDQKSVARTNRHGKLAVMRGRSC